jgi:putative spermidine/putrescine transport system permease protein
VLYLGSLVALLLQSLYRIEEFTGLLVRDVSLDTYGTLLDRANVDIIVRTTLMAAAVTVACAVLAFPLSYHMARFASPRMRAALYLAVLMPLWSSYLVRVYSWKLILAREGAFSWFVDRLGLSSVLEFLLGVPGVGGPSLSQSFFGMFIVFVYMWLPYMILPLEAGLERVPASFLEASSDLGARPGLTFRKVVLPLALPGLVAGSIFTFSLTLGDFIIPTIIGNSAFFIGPVVYVQQGTAGNLPLAAAFSVVPVVIMLIYLTVARRMGAFEAL